MTDKDLMDFGIMLFSLFVPIGLLTATRIWLQPVETPDNVISGLVWHFGFCLAVFLSITWLTPHMYAAFSQYNVVCPTWYTGIDCYFTGN